MNINEVIKECEILKNALLPDLDKADDPERGPYSDDANKKIAAFCVMAHAEIEYYIEETILTKIDEIFKNLEKNPSSKVIPSLCFYYGQDKRNSEFNMNNVHGWYKKIIQENHGIKESNLQSLLDPIGMPVDQLDSVLLSELSSFGSDRGKFAHKSYRKVIREIPNPKDLYNRVQRILSLLAEFESKFSSHG